MKVFRLEKAISTKELATTLKEGFSDKYSYEFFGLESDQSIIVRKSPFVGAQVYSNGNEITIQGIAPAKITWPLIFLDIMNVGLPLISIFLFGSSWKKLEKELALYLNHTLRQPGAGAGA